MASERQLISRLADFFGSHRDLVIGIGDDAAVVRSRHANQVLCCDPVIAGVHFDADEDLRLVGRKAVNRNVSDLAAMGARPAWLLVSLIVPRDASDRELSRLLDGIRAAAKACDAVVVGGDVASSDGPLVVTVTATGHLTGRALTRSGARIGDTLHVSGPLGGSRLGHHLRFRPAVAEGQWLAKQRDVNAAIDVSDGLLHDLQTMLEASGGLGAELDVRRIPVRAAARRHAVVDGRTVLDHALSDGEDHVLLWTQRRAGKLPAGGPLKVRARQAIGRVLPEPGLWLVDGKTRRAVEVAGFEHRWGGGANG